MALTTPQILWHGRDPVLGVDVSKSGLVASAGNDNEVRLWKISTGVGEQPDVVFYQELNGHAKSVNAVRFSPDGETLASASDDTSIILWKDKGVRPSSFGSSAPQGDGTWGVMGILRGHCADVYDLSWSPDGQGLVSGGVDGSCIVWSISKGRVQQTIRDHEHYVQGVGWDPRGELLVSVSCDRSARIYSNRTRKGALRDFACTSAISKTKRAAIDHADAAALAAAGAAVGGATPAAADAEPPPLVLPMDEEKEEKRVKEVRLFLDDTVPSFFRRPAWSPDGAFLLLPCGQHTDTPDGRAAPATLVFARADLTTPCAYLPGPTKPVVAVRCCPVLFELRAPAAASEAAAVPTEGAPAAENATTSWMPLGYRVVWAVATLDSLLLYDSQHTAPLLLASSIHYAALTDLAWLPNGEGLIVSSSDGYCSILMLQDGQLGTPLPADRLPPCMQPKAPEPEPPAAAAAPSEEPAASMADDDATKGERDAPAAASAPAATEALPEVPVEALQEVPVGAPVDGKEAPPVGPWAAESAAGAIGAGETHTDGLQVKKKPKRAVLIPL